MSNKDLIKKLTSKNKTDYEPVAHQLINTPDISLFEELVNQDDFLFDFVKRNVSQRLQNACNASNYRNLLALMKVYSPFYEDFIASTLAKFADEDLTDELLEIFENGTEAEKTYCAKYFSHIKDPLALEFLRESAFSENEIELEIYEQAQNDDDTGACDGYDFPFGGHGYKVLSFLNDYSCTVQQAYERSLLPFYIWFDDGSADFGEVFYGIVCRDEILSGQIFAFLGPL